MAAYFGSYYNEQRLSEYDTALYSGYGDVTGTYGYDDSFSSLDDIFHLFLSYNSNSPSVEEFTYGSIVLPYRREDGFEDRSQHENVTIEEADEREHQPFLSCGNWLSEYNIYSNGCGEDFPHSGNYNNGHDIDVETTENIYQSEEWGDNYYEDIGKQLACDYNFWDGHWSKFENGEEYCIEYGRQELKPKHAYNQDVMGFCEDIFGSGLVCFRDWHRRYD